jgi:hypothetical protein
MKTHNGSCHCGAIRFTATLDIAKATRCNCSVCTKLGYIGCLTRPADVVLTAGEPASYEWGGKIAKRYFCAACGTHCFAKGDLPEVGGPFASVNLSTLDDVDPYQLTVIHWDGRHNNWEAGPRPMPWPIFRDAA